MRKPNLLLWLIACPLLAWATVAGRPACAERVSITVDGRTIHPAGWTPLASGNQVGVHLSLPATNLVSDSLQVIGLTIDGKHLIASAARRRP